MLFFILHHLVSSKELHNYLTGACKKTNNSLKVKDVLPNSKYPEHSSYLSPKVQFPLWAVLRNFTRSTQQGLIIICATMGGNVAIEIMKEVQKIINIRDITTAKILLDERTSCQSIPPKHTHTKKNLKREIQACSHCKTQATSCAIVDFINVS